MKPILIIGATGHIGRQVIAQLPAASTKVRALVRSPQTANLPPEVEVIQGDLTKPDSLEPCLDGIETVFLVWTAPAATVASCIARVAERARRLVFLSAPIKTQHPFFQQPNPARALAEHVESTIEASGLEWTFLRPGIFALNALHFWGPQIRAGGPVSWPYLDAPTAPVDERDIAAVAVRALCEEGHSGKEYVLTGPQSLTQHEQISTIGNVIGRSLAIEEVTPGEAREGCLSAFPPPVATLLLNAWAAAVGQPAFVTNTVQEITGTPARSFADWAATNAESFRA